ncbi:MULTISPECIES: peptidyl-prolyl cis-trans isomerase [unclassified Nocardioides]|uniref:peptidyl-prolyl cis-trans isomerase n=1 Tax=unclassified Nocardioides TaxID=2615069 RepID=UPI0007036CA6|nr:MULTISPECIES: peptidyl-prolyl cis-trans isomerase [unclassified Nocardioides]KRC46456.1 hypothetical protein ASE19_21780 [Nocardioides sp. Root79]KRC69800.1 hypothetical protein ASE20_14630 [Nocardioides sp. Root240]
MPDNLVDEPTIEDDTTDVVPAGGPNGDSAETVTVRGALASLRERLGGRPRASLALAVVVALSLAAGTAFLIRDRALPAGTVAEVGDTTITVKELDQRIDALKALYGLDQPSGGKALDTFRRDAAKSAVVSVLIEKAAADRDIVVTDKQVDTILAKLIKDRYPDGGQRAFVEALGVMGANEAQVRDELHQQAVVAHLFDDVTADVEVTDEDVADAFDDREESLATPERRSLLNIVVETRSDAQAVLGLLRKGQPFGSVARTYSIDSATSAEGGRLGVASQAELDDAYGKAAFAVPSGALFGPVKTSTGWHVGRVEKVTPGAPAVYADVQVKLKRSLVTEGAVAEWRAFLEDLLDDADVRYNADYRPDSPTSLPTDVQGAQP